MVSRVGSILLTRSIYFVRWVLLSIQGKFLGDSSGQIHFASFSQPHQVYQNITHLLASVLSLSLSPTCMDTVQARQGGRLEVTGYG